jgi:hypothetical protein
VVDEVEQLVVGPVQVLEDQHQRSLLGHPFEEAAPRCKALAPPIAFRVLRGSDPDEWPQVRLDPRGVAPVGNGLPVEQGGVLTYWRRGRSLPYGEGVPLWALSEIVKSQAGILESDSPDEATAKLRLAVANGVRAEIASVVTRERARSASHTGTGASLPFASTASASR